MSPKKGHVPARRRLDVLLVERGLFESREKARAAILAGMVRTGDTRLDKAGALLAADIDLALLALPRFVGRGGEKLDGALADLGLDVAGIRALDVGASTGGFTDCLLQRGASRIVALDVGKGQLDWRLRNDPRVVVLEGVNVRYVEPGQVGGPFDLIVVDVAFISLRLVLPPLGPLLASAPQRWAEDPPPQFPSILALVKPQFEVGRGAVGRGGIVRDPALHAEAIERVVLGAHDCGLGAGRMVASRLRGAEGNREFFVHFLPRYDPDAVSVAGRIRAVVGA